MRRFTVPLKIWPLTVTALLVLLCVAPVGCAIAAGAIAQSYRTASNTLAPGTLLSSTAAHANTVESANSTSNVAYLVGVAADKPLLQLSASGQNSVQVVTGGTTQALVSDINGAVKAGDKITASPIGGIGMKAVRAVEIVGTAQASLASVPTAKRTVTGADGKKVVITVGLLPVAVNVAYFSAAASASAASSFVPPFLQTIANLLTGRQVSPLRVLLGASALLLGFIAVIVMLYVSIRQGVVSLGRNPLAAGALRKGLVDVIIAAIGVLIITVAMVYGILLS